MPTFIISKGYQVITKLVPVQVTAAWYVVTETDSALRQGANVTGTIMLVLRKRHQRLETFRDDLGCEIEEAVKQQMESLVGLDK